jgi:16S rRNA C1402 (ribose-2'-O) methylase RsmI
VPRSAPKLHTFFLLSDAIVNAVPVWLVDSGLCNATFTFTKRLHHRKNEKREKECSAKKTRPHNHQVSYVSAVKIVHDFRMRIARVTAWHLIIGKNTEKISIAPEYG